MALCPSLGLVECVYVYVFVHIYISTQESSTEMYTPAQAEKHIHVNVSITFIQHKLSENPLHARHECWGKNSE